MDAKNWLHSLRPPTAPKPILAEISVVIPTLGRPILENSLAYLLAGDVWPGGVVVVDQGMNPAVAEWLAILQAAGITTTYLPTAERGRAVGLNRGLAQVTTRYVAITDDDCFVERAWLKNMMAHLAVQAPLVVTGRVLPAGDEEVIGVVDAAAPALYRRPRLKFDNLSGGNMGTSLAVFQQVGFFDEHPTVRTSEDGEWAYRALRAGVPIQYTPEVTVYHYGWRPAGERLTQYQSYARTHGGFYGKYLRQGDGFIALRALLHYGRAVFYWLKGTIRRDADLAMFGRAYVTGLLPGIIAGMKRER